MGLRSFIKNLVSREQETDNYFRARESTDDGVWSAIAEAERQGFQISHVQKARIEQFLRNREILEESLEIARTTNNEITKSSRLEVVRDNLLMIEELEEKHDLPVSLSNKSEIWSEYYELSGASEGLQVEAEDYEESNPVDFNQYLGKSWGEIVSELTGGANLVDGKQCWQLADDFKHDLPKMLECCHAQLKTMEQAGEMPAPYYFERAAILFRKEKKSIQEVQIIDLYLKAIEAWNNANGNKCPNGGGARHLKIVARLAKAKQLAAKQNKEYSLPS